MYMYLYRYIYTSYSMCAHLHPYASQCHNVTNRAVQWSKERSVRTAADRVADKKARRKARREEAGAHAHSCLRVPLLGCLSRTIIRKPAHVKESPTLGHSQTSPEKVLLLNRAVPLDGPLLDSCQNSLVNSGALALVLASGSSSPGPGPRWSSQSFSRSRLAPSLRIRTSAELGHQDSNP